MDQRKINALGLLQSQVAQRDSFLQAKEKALKYKENQLRRGNIPLSGLPDSSTNRPGSALQANMQNNLPPGMVPGNVGDINRVIWPFYFTTDYVSINPDQSIRSGFTITQEAA